ncbi:hypothetical protein BB561_004273 [Smittium simulii]|uniref:Sphingolipid delta4-desaturase N-terminal domain-containing protein n=1 Tax=Smittium simulii TaxID=133385 RepID=A0A2T9YH83_9FUNG|nr:hypothetical protein BB561_004273 [Smittium simulii]
MNTSGESLKNLVNHNRLQKANIEDPNAVKSWTKKSGVIPMSQQKKIDPRHPLYIGLWSKKSNSPEDKGIYDFMDEPHQKRKKVMLQKYPHIKALYGNQPLTALIAFLLVLTQLYLAYIVGNSSLKNSRIFLFASSYFLGGTIVGIYGVILHEAAHGLIFKKLMYNRLIALFTNLPMVVPIAMSFRRYHLEHHQYQGVVGADPDLPIELEVKLVGNNPILKFFWVLFYGPMYMARGAALKKKPTFWEVFNLIYIIFADVILVFLLGWRAFGYLSLSVLFGYGIHPGAAHFIQEHYISVNGQETYSYYGVLNYLYMNIGYHNEHHDFPQIPWTQMKTLYKIAPEFYEPLYSYNSWVWLIIDFITNKDFTPASRLIRSQKSHINGRTLYKVPDLE